MMNGVRLRAPRVPGLGMKVGAVVSTPVMTASPKDGLKDVAAKMLGSDISMVPVVEAGGEIKGVITEADLVRILTTPSRGEAIVDTAPPAGGAGTVGSVMRRHVIGVTEDAEVTEVARLMVEQHLKSLPVVSHGRLVGIVTRRDVMRLLIRSDEEIHAEVGDALGTISDRPFSVTVEDGMVTVGTLVEPSGRRFIEHAIKTVPGVFAVVFRESAP
jgi:CBS domain-containing protein